MPAKLTTKEFIERARSVHGDKYDYSKVEYTGALNKVIITCAKHGEFHQIANNHISGSGCEVCGRHSSTKSFIIKSKSIHGDKYDYSKVEYKNAHTKVCIICPKHGEFWQAPNSHLNGKGCFRCVDHKQTLNEFIQKAKSIHGDRYDYSNVEYEHSQKYITIVCPIHGKFKQTPNSHLSNRGCPKCNCSKGENEIREILKSCEISFIEQYRFNDCRNKRTLPFDFYLPELNLCIEYDGEQHFKPVEKFGGYKSFKTIIIHDKIKTNYCINNDINLIRIRYDDDIENILRGRLWNQNH